MDAYADALIAGPKSKRERYEQLRSALWNTRSSGGFDTHWRDLADFILPRRIRLHESQRNQGGKANQNILDSSAKFAANTLASGLHAGLTSPARPWFKLGTPDPDLAEFGPVKEWLHIVTQRLQTFFAGSNLYNALPVLYGDMGVFGTAAMGMFDDTKDVFRCYSYPIGSYAVGVDNRGLVGTFVRVYVLTVRQTVQEFCQRPNRGLDTSVLSTRVKQAWDQGSYEDAVAIAHVIAPNEEAGRGFGAKYLPFSSCHYELATRETPDGAPKFLRESGFQEFPMFVPRWATTGEDSYGTDCPGMTALGDVRQLQSMQRSKGQMLAKKVNPPLKANYALRTQATSSVPGGITYVDRLDNAGSGLAPIYETTLEGYQFLLQDLQDVRYLIRRAFYEDLFLMLAASDAQRGSQPITAREVDERHEEKLLALGPVLERTNDELLSPLIDRVYAMADRKGLIPDPPQDLNGVKLKVEFISILAQAQKLVGVSALDRFAASMVPLAEVWPEVREKIDADQLVENYAEALGIDPRIIRSTEETQQRVEGLAKQQQAMAAAETAKNMAGAAAQAGAKPIAPDSALDRLLKTVGSAA